MDKTTKENLIGKLLIGFVSFVCIAVFCWWLDEFVTRIRGAMLTPRVEVECVSGFVNGPESVPLVHPQIAISSNYVNTDYWTKIVFAGGENYLIGFNPKSIGAYRYSLDGYINGDIRDSRKPLFILVPGKYILQGYSGTYTIDVPKLGKKLFETTFVVPDCSKK